MITQLYGLIGHPLGHSFSAKYFAEKFDRENLDAEYRNFDIPDAAQVIALCRENPLLKGLNVTIPHKQSVIPYLDELQHDAQQIGAVNVIKISRSGGTIHLKGYNTDYIGFSRSLQPYADTLPAALVLGTGGAAKAICYALRALHIDIQLVSRHKTAQTLTYDELTPSIVQAHPLIVNTTPLGMFPHVDTCPDIPYEFLGSGHLLYDLTYNPSQTLFLKKGIAAGAKAMNGLEMLHRQAEAAWEIWQEEVQ